MAGWQGWRALAVVAALGAAAVGPEAQAQAARSSAAAKLNPLEAYVARPDPSYRWSLNSSFKGPGYTAYVIDLTSQTWRKPNEVDRTVWKHWLTVIKPDQVKHDKALLYITGGNNGDPAPTKVSERSAQLATGTGSVVAELGMVPNQPLRFSDSPDVARYEDDIISHVQNKQIASKDDEWILRLPMTKSGVRAMDAVQAFMASDAGGRVKIDKFVVAGGSKRGWTTWTVGAVDRRVAAIMPLVIDVLNVDPVSKHHYEALGYFSPALGDYVRHGLMPEKIGSPELGRIRDFEDPYSYRNTAAMRMPKYIINAAGDEFFLPTNSQFYYPGLREEKRLRYVPNAKHNLAGSDVVESMLAFYEAVLTDTPRPEYSWSKLRDGAMLVRTKQKPREVNLWQATNPNARDFRLDVIGKAYTKTTLQPQPDGTYLARLAKPAKGYTAYFVELVYDGPGKHPFKFTTEVAVTPEALPYKWNDALRRARAAGANREALLKPEVKSGAGS
jgi:PhoPQ-activated pathogenicity-related protein